jgi:hypothetical protein
MNETISLKQLIDRYYEVKKSEDKEAKKKLYKEGKFLENNMRLYQRELMEVYGKDNEIIKKLDDDIMLVYDIVSRLERAK